jgi:D-arabinose 1-dehydrogenase-like Zn-dependent alcohol dehydrogenase
MKAVVAPRFGASWEVKARHKDPEPGARDVVVEILASGICYTDVGQLHDKVYGCTFPRIPGHEPVGKVVALGREVTAVGLGDIVGVAYCQRWCGVCSYCSEGRYEHCTACSFTGITVDGGHAELMVIDAAAVEKVPVGMDPVQAAPVFCAGFTVYSGICDCCIRPGERCAVIGVGGLGHLGVQYAAALGAEVVCVTASEDKVPILRELGASQILVSAGKSAGEMLKQIGGVDVILNTANGVAPDIVSGLRAYGRISLIGACNHSFPVTPTQMSFGKFTIMGSSQGPRARLREVLELHQRSRSRVIVEDYPLDDALAAFERVRTGEARFRAVLVPQ